MRAGCLLILASCTAAPDVPCSSSLLDRESGYTLYSPAGTTFAPTVIFGEPSGEHPESCYYARDQGDAACTEDGGWVDNMPGAKDGTVTVTPFGHACGSFAVGGSYTLMYSFTKFPGILWIEAWSNND